tara:strand:+ start:1662 stop:1859 length:198 start_codon:yes stop_codon:yes gene_type:complete
MNTDTKRKLDTKIKLFAKLVSEINISKYKQKEYLNIIDAIKFEIFDANEAEKLPKFGDLYEKPND